MSIASMAGLTATCIPVQTLMWYLTQPKNGRLPMIVSSPSSRVTFLSTLPISRVFSRKSGESSIQLEDGSTWRYLMRLAIRALAMSLMSSNGIPSGSASCNLAMANLSIISSTNGSILSRSNSLWNGSTAVLAGYVDGRFGTLSATKSCSFFGTVSSK